MNSGNREAGFIPQAKRHDGKADTMAQAAEHTTQITANEQDKKLARKRVVCSCGWQSSPTNQPHQLARIERAHRNAFKSGK